MMDECLRLGLPSARSFQSVPRLPVGWVPAAWKGLSGPVLLA